MRTFQDSDITAGFMIGADIYGAYVLSDTGEGHDNYAATVVRFPTALHLSICTRFNASAQCLDFEAATTGTTLGDAQQCVQWVVRMRATGIEPTVYVQLSLWDWLAGVFDAAGVARPGWWIAHWTGVAHLEPGSDATQWQGGSLVDLSMAADYWPTVDAGHDPSGGGTPINPPSEEPLMAQVKGWIVGDSDGTQWLVDADLMTSKIKLLPEDEARVLTATDFNRLKVYGTGLGLSQDHLNRIPTIDATKTGATS